MSRACLSSSRPVRRVWLSLLIAVPLWIVGSDRVATGQQATFRSSVDLIAVDVQVLDSSGRPSIGLGPEKFAVTISGKARRVVSADLIQHNPAQRSTGEIRSLAPVARNTFSAPTSEGRTFALVVDVSSFDAAAWQRAMTATRAFIARLHPSDSVGLYTYPAGPAFAPTTNQAAIARQLDVIVGLAHPFQSQFGLRPSEVVDITSEMVRLNAGYTGVRRDADAGPGSATLAAVQERECPNDSGCPARILMDAYAAAQEMELQMNRSVEGLRGILDALIHLPGRKTVVLISAGMVVSDKPGGRPAADDLARALGRQLAQSNASIYTVHVDQSNREMYSATNKRASMTSSNFVRERSMRSRWLSEFSSASGGSLIHVETDDGESALGQVLQETSAYYLLGVEPDTRDRDGRLRELKVKVEPRAGLTVRHRMWVIVPPAKK